MSDHTDLGDRFFVHRCHFSTFHTVLATTWQTRLVAYLELVIYLLNATIILLQNTKLTVKFTRDGRPYPVFDFNNSPIANAMKKSSGLWDPPVPAFDTSLPLAWAASVHGWLMADRQHGEPNTLWPSDYRSPNCIIKRVRTCFEAQNLLFLIGCDK